MFRETGKAKDFTMRMEMPLSHHHFNREDSVRGLDFPALLNARLAFWTC